MSPLFLEKPSSLRGLSALLRAVADHLDSLSEDRWEEVSRGVGTYPAGRDGDPHGWFSRFDLNP